MAFNVVPFTQVTSFNWMFPEVNRRQPKNAGAGQLDSEAGARDDDGGVYVIESGSWFNNGHGRDGYGQWSTQSRVGNGWDGAFQ